MLDPKTKLECLAKVSGLDTDLPIEYHIRTIRERPNLGAYELCRHLGRESHLTMNRSYDGGYESYINIRADAPYKLAKAFKKNGFGKEFYKQVWRTIKLFFIHQSQRKKLNEPLEVDSYTALHNMIGVPVKRVKEFYQALNQSGVVTVKTVPIGISFTGKERFYIKAYIRFKNMGSNKKDVSVPLPKAILDKVLTDILKPAPMLTWLLMVSNTARFSYKSFYYFQVTTYQKRKVVKLIDSMENFLRCMNVFEEDIKYLESICFLTGFICNRLDEPKSKIHFVVLHGLREFDERLGLHDDLKAKVYHNEVEPDECELTKQRIENKRVKRKTVKFTHPESGSPKRAITHPESVTKTAQNARMTEGSGSKNRDKFTHPESGSGSKLPPTAQTPRMPGFSMYSVGDKFTHPESGNYNISCYYYVPLKEGNVSNNNNNRNLTTDTKCENENDVNRNCPSAPSLEATGIGQQQEGLEKANNLNGGKGANSSPNGSGQPKSGSYRRYQYIEGGWWHLGATRADGSKQDIPLIDYQVDIELRNVDVDTQERYKASGEVLYVDAYADSPQAKGGGSETIQSILAMLN